MQAESICSRPFRLPVPHEPCRARRHLPLIEPDVQISRIRLSDQRLMRAPTNGQAGGAWLPVVLSQRAAAKAAAQPFDPPRLLPAAAVGPVPLHDPA